MVVKDVSYVVALLHARTFDIQADAVRDRIRSAWAFHSSFVARDFDPAATELYITTLLLVTYSSNRPSSPTNGLETPPFYGLTSILQLGESSRSAISDFFSGAADVSLAGNEKFLKGQLLSASFCIERLKPLYHRCMLL